MHQSQNNTKHQTTINISKPELKNILAQFEPDILRDDEATFNYKNAMQSLDKSDQIIFSLYAELESERKVAELLGVSRSPIHKIICGIREQILNNVNKEQNNDIT